MSDLISVTVNDGKYTVRQTGPGRWECLRYGEAWPAFEDRGPDNLHTALAYEVDKLRREVTHMSKPDGTFAWALHQMLWEQAEVIRNSQPHIDYSFDGAEGCSFWKMDHDEDELDRHAFTCEQILATDWEVKWKPGMERPASPRPKWNPLAIAQRIMSARKVGV